MTRSLARQSATGLFIAVMGVLAWFCAVQVGQARGYFLAVIVALMPVALFAVREGKHPRYALGVIVGILALSVSTLPGDLATNGGYCGSVIHPHHGWRAYDSDDDPYSYFEACDRVLARNAMVVISGIAVSGLLIGTSLRTTRRRERPGERETHRRSPAGAAAGH